MHWQEIDVFHELHLVCLTNNLQYCVGLTDILNYTINEPLHNAFVKIINANACKYAGFFVFKSNALPRVLAKITRFLPIRFTLTGTVGHKLSC